MPNYHGTTIGSGVALVTPSADGDANQVIETDGAGTLSFVDPASGTVTASGTPVDGQIAVFTSATDVEGDAALSFDTTTDKLTIAASGDLAFGASIVLSDNAGSTTLANIDSLDSTTESTIEAAIDNCPNLVSAAALATVGTIGTGTWQGTAIADAYVAGAAGWDAKGDLSDGDTMSTGLTFPIAGLHILDTGGDHDLIISPGSDVTADRTLTITTGDSDRAITLSGDTTLTGSNTGDQTITLTGDVTGTGTGSFAATIAVDAVTYDKMQDTSATDKLLGRSTAGAGTVEEIACTAYARSVLDDADAATARGTLGVDIAGTDNSTDVTLAGSYDYITIAGQVITRNQIVLTTDVSGVLPIANMATGTPDGTKFVRDDGTLQTPAGGGDVSDGDTLSTGLTFPIAGLHILDTNGSHDLIVSPGSNLTADRTLTITTGDANRTITLSGDTTLSGSNTGDQTITLTGDVTGTGTGSFAATIAADSVTYDKMQDTSATDKLLGRSTAGAGTVEEIACTSYARSVLDDADAATARGTLDVDQAGTDNSTDVTLAGALDYLTIAGQAITRNAIDLAADVTGTLPVTAISGTKANFDAALSDGGFAFDSGAHHDNFSDYVAAEHYDWTGDQGIVNIHQNNLPVAAITSGTITGITDLAIADGGTGASTAQAAINALTAVSGATNEHVLTKDTATGNAVFKVAAAGSGDVSASGSPLADQVAVWVNGTTIEGDADLTFDTATNRINIGASGSVAFNSVVILDDTAGSTELANIDAIDATTEATLEAALDFIAATVDDTSPELGGELDCGAHSVGFTAQSSTGDGTTTIDWKLGNKYHFTFGSQNDTFTFTAPSNPCNLILTLTQDSVGSRTATWPATVMWPAGTEPTLTTTATTGKDIISFYWDGTNYWGMAGLNFSVPA